MKTNRATKPKRLLVTEFQNGELKNIGYLTWNGELWFAEPISKKDISGQHTKIEFMLRSGIRYGGKNLMLSDYSIWEPLVNGRISRITFTDVTDD